MENDIRFVSFLAGLAPEGETLLIVRQKAYTSNGARKSAWLPQLPSDHREPGRAWYANTGSFRPPSEDWKPAASMSFCTRVLCMVLDDIGTKSRKPPLPPTWVMETSESNFQWGYAFSAPPPSPDLYSAAIKAIAKKGYTDPGSTNAVRNFRIPGSVNLKDGRGGFVSRLVQFKPERRFSLDEICLALGVTPGDPEPRYVPPTVLYGRNGEDSLLRWLEEQRLVLGPPDTDGWMSIICPNARQHTNGDNAARYNTRTRVFKCFHGHCVEFDTSSFLSWVAAHGGPDVQAGIRDDLTDDLLRTTVSKIPPTPLKEQADDGIAETQELGAVRERERERQKALLACLKRDYGYIHPDDSYVHLPSKTVYTRKAFNALYRGLRFKSKFGRARKDGSISANDIEASVWFDQIRDDIGAPVFDGLTYAPGEKDCVRMVNKEYFNIWEDARPKVLSPGAFDVAQAEPWLAHVKDLVPDAVIRNHLLDIMAFKLKNPKVKINHGVLLGGVQGCGKDTLFAPFFWAVCGPDGKNRAMLDNDRIQNQWGYHLESEIVVINELKEPLFADRRALANRLKPLLAAPPMMNDVNKKGMHPYPALNRSLVIAFSNYRVPLSLPADDRRFLVIWAEAPSRNLSVLWRWYRDGGFAAVAQWLWVRDVSAFDPGEPPPMTDAKRLLIDGGRTLAEANLIGLMRDKKGPFGGGVIEGSLDDIVANAQPFMPDGVKLHQGVLLDALQEGGWRPYDLGRKYRNVWLSPELAERVRTTVKGRDAVKTILKEKKDSLVLPNVSYTLCNRN